MVGFFKDSALVLGRIITILPLLLFVTLYMGKRAISELPVFDFLVIVISGAVVGADIADPEIKHLPTAVAIIGIALLQRFVAMLKISKRNLGHLITFEPTIVIQNGKLLNENLKKIRYSIDNVLQMLREKDVFDISEVETAIIEASGNISVLKKPEKIIVTREDMNIPLKPSAITYPVIVEGELYPDVLSFLNLDETWLFHQLKHDKINDIKEVFFASINQKHELQISLKKDVNVTVPIIKH